MTRQRYEGVFSFFPFKGGESVREWEGRESVLGKVLDTWARRVTREGQFRAPQTPGKVVFLSFTGAPGLAPDKEE